MNASTAIVLLNWNGWRDTIECLQSLTKLVHPSYAVVVVDNASSDGSMKQIVNWLGNQTGTSSEKLLIGRPPIAEDQIGDLSYPLAHRSVSLIQAKENGGFAAGNNLGLRLALSAQCEYMWLLNNDTIVHPHALTALERRIKGSPQIGMVGSLLCYHDQPETIQAVGGVQFNYWRVRGTQVGQGLSLSSANLHSLAEQPLSYIAGASILVSKAFLNDVGLMYEGYFLYFEEIDWAIRAQPKWGLATAIDSIVFHKEGGSIGTSSRATRSALSQYYLTRNSIVCFWRHKPLLLPIALANILYECLKLALVKKWLLARCTLRALFRGCMGEYGKSQIK